MPDIFDRLLQEREKNKKPDIFDKLYNKHIAEQSTAGFKPSFWGEVKSRAGELVGIKPEQIMPAEQAKAGYRAKYDIGEYNFAPQPIADAIQKTESILGSTNGMLTEIAKVESDFGRHPNTFTGASNGVWQIDDIGLLDTQDVNSHPNLKKAHEKIKKELGIDWLQVRPEDLKDPLMGAIAARLHLLNVPEAIPKDPKERAAYWKKYYNTEAGKGTPEKYLADIATLQQKAIPENERIPEPSLLKELSTMMQRQERPTDVAPMPPTEEFKSRMQLFEEARKANPQLYKQYPQFGSFQPETFNPESVEGGGVQWLLYEPSDVLIDLFVPGIATATRHGIKFALNELVRMGAKGAVKRGAAEVGIGAAVGAGMATADLMGGGGPSIILGGLLGGTLGKATVDSARQGIIRLFLKSGLKQDAATQKADHILKTYVSTALNNPQTPQAREALLKHLQSIDDTGKEAAEYKQWWQDVLDIADMSKPPSGAALHKGAEIEGKPQTFADRALVTPGQQPQPEGIITSPYMGARPNEPASSPFSPELNQQLNYKRLGHSDWLMQPTIKVRSEPYYNVGRIPDDLRVEYAPSMNKTTGQPYTSEQQAKSALRNGKKSGRFAKDGTYKVERIGSEQFVIQRTTPEKLNQIDEDLRYAFDKMHFEYNNTAPRGVSAPTAGQEAAGQGFDTVSYGSERPEWVSKFGLDNLNEFNAIYKNLVRGKRLTDKQEELYQKMIEAAQWVKKNDPEIAAADDLKELSKGGWEPVLVGRPIKEYDEGDVLRIGKATSMGLGESTEVTVKKVDPFETVTVVDKSGKETTYNFNDVVEIQGVKRSEKGVEPGAVAAGSKLYGMAPGALYGVETEESKDNVKVGDGFYINPKKMLAGMAAVGAGMTIKQLYGGETAKGWETAKQKFSALWDRKPRFEIDDSGAKLKLDAFKKKGFDAPTAIGRLGEFYDHPELYKQYPDAANDVWVSLKIDPDMGKRFDGRYLAPNDEYKGSPARIILRAKTKADLEDSLTHEVQHHIQAVEGFARGGSPKQFEEKTKELEEMYDTLTSSKEYADEWGKYENYISKNTDKDFDELTSWKTLQKFPRVARSFEIQDQIAEADPYTLYKRIAGEIEAFDAGARRTGTQLFRETAPPYSSSNVPAKDIIVPEGRGTQAAVSGPAPLDPKQEAVYKRLSGELDNIKRNAARVGKSVEQYLTDLRMDPAIIERLVRSDADLGKYAESINLERMDIPTELKHVLKDMERPKQTVTWDTVEKTYTEKFLKDLESRQKVLNDLGKTFDEPGKLSGQVYALRSLEANVLQGLSDSFAKGDYNSFVKNYASFRDGIFKLANDVSSELGRTFNMLKKDAGARRLVHTLNLLDKKLTREQLDMLGKINIEDPIAVKRFYDDIATPKLHEYFIEFFYNNILSGPPTHIINITSNTLWQMFQVPHHILTASLDKLFTGFTRGKRTTYLNELVPMFAGYKSGFKRGAKSAYEVIRYNMVQEFDTKWANEIGYARGAFERSPSKALRALAPVISAPTRALRAMDVWANAMAYDAKVRGIARRVYDGLSVKPPDRQGWEREFLKNLPRKYHEEAMKFAKYSTFMDDPDPITSALIKVRDAVPLGLGRANPIFGVPFINTIANLTKRGMEMTPFVGLAKAGLSHAGAKTSQSWASYYAQKGVPKSAEIWAKQIEGFVVGAAIYEKIRKGEITGNYPEDPAEREAWLRDGKTAWSIKLGNNWIQYRRMEPFNTVIATTVNFFQKYKDAPDDEKIEGLTSFANSMVENLIDSSYLKGIQPLFDRFADRETAIKRWSHAWVPYSSMFRSIVRASEAYEEGAARVHEMPEEFVNSFSLVIPFIKTLQKAPVVGQYIPDRPPAKIEVWGEEVRLEGGMFRQWLPWKWQTAKNDPVEKKLADLNKWADRNDVLFGYPSRPSRSVTHKGKDYSDKITDEMYRDYAITLGNALYKKYAEMVKDPHFNELPEKKQIAKMKLRRDNIARKAKRQLKREMRDAGLFD